MLDQKTSTHRTEVGLLALWDSNSLAYIKTPDDYEANLVDGRNMVDLMNKGFAVIWNTGGDGAFDITTRVDPEGDLTEEEKELVSSSSLNHKFVVTSNNVYLGSPEWIGTFGNDSSIQPDLRLVEDITAGIYLVNVYFLFHEEEEESNPETNKTGFVVVIKKVEETHEFSQVNEVPRVE
jgi:hypothetical protein